MGHVTQPERENAAGARSWTSGVVSYVAVLVVVAGAAIAGCRAQDPVNHPFGQNRLSISGSSTIAPLVSEIAKRFESHYPGVRVDVQTGGSSRGVADVRRGTVEIGMVSRPLVPAEADLTAHLIAMDGVALIVHAENPVLALTGEQIGDIFLGQIDTWEAVGGPAAPITVVNKAEGRSTLDLFASHFGLDRNAIRAHVVIGENLHGVRTVAGDPHAIGYVSIGTAEFEQFSGVPIRMLPLDGVEPTMANVRNGTFPLARPLNLATAGERTALTDAFLALASSSEVNDLVEGQFFVPIAD